MEKLYIGTSGYSYADWRGVFYPPELDKKSFLSFYAERFSFVELNFSYYRQPNSNMISKIIEKTPEGFLFSIKGHRSITHDRNREWKKEVDEFAAGIRPLREEGRLAGVLLQFPYSFHRDKENRLYLGEVCSYLADFPLFLEFRNSEWQLPEVYEELTRRNIGIVNTDSPELHKLPEPSSLATSERGYVRFHGRNRENWWRGDNVSRYDYLYDERELREWVERIEEVLAKVKVLFLAFNNHHKGQAVTNAFQLASLLGDGNVKGSDSAG